MHSDFFCCKYATFSLLEELFHSRCVAGIFFLNHFTPPFEGKVMPKGPKVNWGFEDFFKWLRACYFKLIAFIISI